MTELICLDLLLTYLFLLLKVHLTPPYILEDLGAESCNLPSGLIRSMTLLDSLKCLK